jgi:hypothetical protein
MAKYTHIEDKDLGMTAILKNIAALSKKAIKAGIVKGTDGEVLEYAAWNEYGVRGPPYSQHGDGKWFIPPRPFIRGWADNKAENIKRTQEKIFKKVTSGKWDADDAIMRLGEFAQDGIKSYIRTGTFTPNADSTIKRKTVRGKKGTTPLINTGTLRNSVRYEVVEGGK